MGTAAPLISIITPSFNQGHFLDATIRSVVEQDYPNLEHLIFDGGSTDSTIDVLRKYPHLKWVSEKDHGQTHAVNKGLQKASGEIIGWVNSDDTFLPGAFHAVVEKFQSDKNCFVVFGNYHAIDEHDKILYSTEGFCGSYEAMIRWWDYTYNIHQPTVFVRPEIVKEIGLLDESFHFTMDHDWWLRIAQHYSFHHIPNYIATYRMHRDAKTFAPLEKYVYPELLRASKKHWGPIWTSRYWHFRKSYHQFLLRKPNLTLHNPLLEEWFASHEKNS